MYQHNKEEVKPPPIFHHEMPKTSRWLIVLILLALVIYGFFLLRGCNDIDVNKMNRTDSLEIQNAVLKDKISQGLKSRDSILKSKYEKDSIQIVFKDRWHGAKNTFSNIEQMPCDSVKKEVPKLIAACDSVIRQDSLIKEDYKRALTVDSTIIDDYRQHVKNDSIIKEDQKNEIATLKKKVKRKTVEARVSQGVGLIGWILAFIK